jgi:hypothetical protein
MTEGMTLRDWFAGQALASMAVYIEDGGTFPSDMAEQAYMYAQSMLDEKTKEDAISTEIDIILLKAKEDARKARIGSKK